MQKGIRNLLVFILTASFVMSFTGCNNKKTDEALVLCDSFCQEVKSGNSDKLLSFLGDSGVSSDELEDVLSPEDLNSDQAAYLDIIKESTDYSVGEAVYDSKTKTVAVNVVWNQADYSSESAASAKNIQEFKTQVSSLPAKEIPVVVTVDLSGEYPKITNPMDTINAVYAYTSYDNGIMPGLLSDYYLDGDLVLAPKGVYTNTEEIGVRINFDKQLFDYRFVPGVMFTVAIGGEAVYVSDIMALEEDSIRLDFTSEIAGSDYLNEYGYLISGTYTIMVFDEHSKEIASFTCEVENEEVEKDEISFEDHKNDYYLSNLVYEFKDSDIMGESYVYMTGWWDYDGTSVGRSAFASNTKTLGFSLAVSSNNETELYYEYYYSEKSDFSDIEENGPVFESSCKPSLYEDQACYDLDYTPADGFEPGFYGLVVYSDASKNNIVVIAACIVVEETTDDVLD